jgi:hypothetical protein
LKDAVLSKLYASSELAIVADTWWMPKTVW